MKQMLPVEIYGSAKAKGDWSLPFVSIMDSPRFAYRGLLLDCCRHFFPVEEVKKVLDLMAIHKMNRLHWHLTEDQGWRIEIKKYPKLTEIGAYRNGTQIFRRNETDGKRYGGFYTQEQLRDVVAYAAERGITIIPEVDLPGHMVAALASYPELGCTGGPYEVMQRWGGMPDVLCVGKEETFTFLEDVLTEVMDIFPSEYINIGGDECPKIRWKECPRCQARIKKLGLKDTKEFSKEHYLQNYVTARIQKFINDHGRKIIGWDEILEGELAPGATVMSWRGTKGGIKAVE
jgi:hexosaminidase